MKTTVDLPDALLNRARRTAAREKTTVRALLEEGLRKVLDDRNHQGAFRLRKASVRGTGLQPGIAQAGWEAIRDVSYKDRGA